MIHTQSATSRWQQQSSQLPAQPSHQQQLAHAHSKQRGSGGSLSLRLRRGWRSLFSRQSHEDEPSASSSSSSHKKISDIFPSKSDVIVDFSSKSRKHRRTVTHGAGALTSAVAPAFSPSNHQGEEPSHTSSVASSVALPPPQKTAAEKLATARGNNGNVSCSARPLAPAKAIPSYFGVAGSGGAHKRSATDTDFLTFGADFLKGAKANVNAKRPISNANRSEADFDEEADFDDDECDAAPMVMASPAAPAPKAVASTSKAENKHEFPTSALKGGASVQLPATKPAPQALPRPAPQYASAVSQRGNLKPSAVRANRLLARSSSVRLSSNAKPFVPRAHMNAHVGVGAKRHQVLNTTGVGVGAGANVADAKPIVAAPRGGAGGAHRRSQTMLVAPTPTFAQMYAPPQMGLEPKPHAIASQSKLAVPPVVPPRPSSTKPPKSILKSKSLHVHVPVRPASVQPVQQQVMPSSALPAQPSASIARPRAQRAAAPQSTPYQQQQQQQQQQLPQHPQQQQQQQHHHTFRQRQPAALSHNKSHAYDNKPRHSRQKSESALLFYGGGETSQQYATHGRYQAHAQAQAHQAAAAAQIQAAAQAMPAAPRNPYLSQQQDARGGQQHYPHPMYPQHHAHAHQQHAQRHAHHYQQQQHAYAAAAFYQQQQQHAAYVRHYHQQQQQQQRLLMQQQQQYYAQQQQLQQKQQRPTHVRHASCPFVPPQMSDQSHTQVQTHTQPQVSVATLAVQTTQEAIGVTIERPGSVAPEPKQGECNAVEEIPREPSPVEPMKIEEVSESEESSPSMDAAQPSEKQAQCPPPGLSERPNTASDVVVAPKVEIAAPKFDLVMCDDDDETPKSFMTGVTTECDVAETEDVAADSVAEVEEAASTSCGDSSSLSDARMTEEDDVSDSEMGAEECEDDEEEQEKPFAFSPPARPASARAVTPFAPFAGPPAAPVVVHTTKTYAFHVPNSKHERAGPALVKRPLPKSYVDTQEVAAKTHMGEITEAEWLAISSEKVEEGVIDERMENPDMDLLLRGYARYISVLVSQSLKQRVEKDHPVHFVPILNRHRGTAPTQSEIFEFIEHLYNDSTPSQECVVVSLMYITRLVHHAPVVRVEAANWVSIVFTAMLLAQKVWDDVNWINRNFLDFGPREIDVEHLNCMEANFLEGMNWDVSFKTSDYRKHFYLLCRLGGADRRKPVLPRAKSS